MTGAGNDARELMVDEVARGIVGEPAYTRGAAAEAAGVPFDLATRLWRAMGFAEAADDAVLFTDRDVAALRTARTLVDAGVVDGDGLLALTRAMAQALSRLAVSHAATAAAFVAAIGDLSDPAAEAAAHAAESLVPDVASLLEFVWRRHLAAAAEGALVAAFGEGAADPAVAVGFADLVGFTERSRGATPAELAELVERFERHAAQLVADHGGRVVKTLGDEVLFTTDDAGSAAALGLALAGATTDLGGDVRVGVAYGPVLARLGDVFGPTVNIASRLTGLARPGSLLVDRGAATALRGDARFDVAPLRRQSVRGYSHLAPFRVRPAASL
ncbi:MAG TPA: adenylate/guanylate cyclase domain-containing protein [Mycobacteriales bacterium]|nr:adenylate/guanylate cyclase domain-containing protein [Mycobacteriales bacterium]